MDAADLAFAVVGVGALLAGLLPRVLERRPLSMPIAFLGARHARLRAAARACPTPDPLAHPTVTEHLTEVGVIVALMGAGLKIDRPLGWRRWASTWRLLAIAMPLTIAAIALLGWWWAGLVPAAALLLGAALAPTDPVLASDVQVGEPTDEEDSEDEVRFALTSEAGLNDGAGLPVRVRGDRDGRRRRRPDRLGRPSGWPSTCCYKLARRGRPAGWSIGWLLGKLFFRARQETLRLAKHSEGFLALAATFLAYGLVEVAGGYGFLAVFVVRPVDPGGRARRTSTTRCCTTSPSRSSGC